MTYFEIKKCIDFIERIGDCENETGFSSLLKEIKNYLGDKYDANLSIESWAQIYGTSYSESDLENDKTSLISFLRGLIDHDEKSAEIMLVIDDIKKGKNTIENKREQESYVIYIYTAYNGKISFPKNVVDFCAGTRSSRFEFQSPINSSIVEGIIQSLKKYALSLSKVESEKGPTTKIENNFLPTNNVNVDISIDIGNARNLAENAGLSQTQLDEVNEKINEIEQLLKSKESKNRIWSKAWAILKWVAEQGIQVASFMVPLLCTLV